jgi:aspartyl protease family protein
MNKNMKLYVIILLVFLPVFFSSSCSQSARNKNVQEAKAGKSEKPGSKRKDRSSSPANIVKMTEKNGVYIVPIEVNGIAMDFILDTGASDVSISYTEAMFLWKQGKLTENDIKGSQQYRTADGNITEGTVIQLKTVKIGNKILHNVEASIVKSLEAPLLLGQSALSKFGKISIDYKKLELKLE